MGVAPGWSEGSIFPAASGEGHAPKDALTLRHAEMVYRPGRISRFYCRSFPVNNYADICFLNDLNLFPKAKKSFPGLLIGDERVIEQRHRLPEFDTSIVRAAERPSRSCQFPRLSP